MDQKILGTALETIGAFGPWFRQNPEFLSSAIELLIKGLNSPMSSQATLGLKELSRDCQIKMQPYAIGILNACQHVMQTESIKNSDTIRLMFAVGKMLRIIKDEELTHYLDAVVGPCFEELQHICQTLNVCFEYFCL